MPIGLSESVKKVLEDKAYGHVVTFNPNGRPQLTMVWMDVEGNEALFNTAEGRKKAQNLRRDPRIIISVQNRNEPQSYLVLNGTATVTETGADAHADKLAKRFLGVDEYPYRQPGEKRLIVRVKVDRLRGIGPKMRPWAVRFRSRSVATRPLVRRHIAEAHFQLGTLCMRAAGRSGRRCASLGVTCCSDRPSAWR